MNEWSVDENFGSEEEYWDEELLAEGLDERSLRQRVFAVMGTSYGISVLAHGCLLAALALIVVATAPVQQEAVILVTNTPKPKPYDPEKRKDVKEQPELPQEEQDVEMPVVDISEPDTPVDTPLGEPDNASNKHMDAKSFSDLTGLAGGPPAGMRGRLDGLARLHGRPGGPPPSEDAVRAALLWLKRHQSRDGRWDADGWHEACGDGNCANAKGGDREQGGSAYDVGLTGLALLAYTGHGNSHRFGEFKRTVNKAMRHLKAQQAKDGSIGFHGAGHGGMYNHALATMALCELYGVSRDFRLKRPAQRAVDFCLSAQNLRGHRGKHKGSRAVTGGQERLGWRYEPRSGRNDTSVTGWMVLALKAAKTAGLEVPNEAFTGAQAWFQRATNSRGLVGYLGPDGQSGMLAVNERFNPKPVMTAVSVVCRIFCGERLSNVQIRQGAQHIAAELPENERNDVSYYYWYYGTYALFQYGGPRWDKWNKAMLGALLPHQKSGGCEDGSWEPKGEWCAAGGRVYAVAINALTLEIYYRYDRQGKL